MAGSVIKFEFEVYAPTLTECIEELDEACNQVMLAQGGEPWVVIKDEIVKKALTLEGLVANDPNSSFYQGVRSVLFAGPTKIGPKIIERDGFRPQAGNDDSPSF